MFKHKFNSTISSRREKNKISKTNTNSNTNNNTNSNSNLNTSSNKKVLSPLSNQILNTFSSSATYKTNFTVMEDSKLDEYKEENNKLCQEFYNMKQRLDTVSPANTKANFSSNLIALTSRSKNSTSPKNNLTMSESEIKPSKNLVNLKDNMSAIRTFMEKV